ncbi:hypothetical protein M0R72_01145 [Candidatus Pacearchaeota archaeon]|jgi:hypothetical protein|nr:hypothetical protein [Candidatus Pacearchaeota archaeon]
MTYAEWIAAYIESQNGIVYGQCSSAVAAMVKVFPELRIVRGHVFDLQLGQRSHWWLVTAAGEIVDPTKGQFPCLMEYEEWVPGTEVRVGACMQCGADIWEAVDSLDGPPIHRNFCSSECEAELISEYR